MLLRQWQRQFEQECAHFRKPSFRNGIIEAKLGVVHRKLFGKKRQLVFEMRRRQRMEKELIFSNLRIEEDRILFLHNDLYSFIDLTIEENGDRFYLIDLMQE